MRLFRTFLWVVAASLAAPTAVLAQRAELSGPQTLLLDSVTPAFTARARAAGPARPIRYTLQAAGTVDFQTSLVFDSTFVSSDTLVPIQLTRPLPSEAVLFFRVRITLPSGITYDSPLIGPRTVPPWLTLLDPNKVGGNQLDTRRPQFVWRSAPIVREAGPWAYDIEITTGDFAVGGTTGTNDTVFTLSSDLEANRSYRWSVRAYLPHGESIRVFSRSSFFVSDPALPTLTLLFQNFPNPFPTPTAFATCFWFDIAEPGGPVIFDILDLRGNVVRNLVPGADGQREFPPGKYGRGAPGAGSNCDGRFVWDATGNDGRTVAPGVYLARFRVGTSKPTLLSILFRGR